MDKTKQISLNDHSTAYPCDKSGAIFSHPHCRDHPELSTAEEPVKVVKVGGEP